jgi:hypothetical protein
MLVFGDRHSSDVFVLNKNSSVHVPNLSPDTPRCFTGLDFGNFHRVAAGLRALACQDARRQTSQFGLLSTKQATINF